MTYNELEQYVKEIPNYYIEVFDHEGPFAEDSETHIRLTKNINDDLQLVFLIVYFNYKAKPKFPYIIECKKIDCKENIAKKILDDHRFSEDQLTKETLDDLIYQVEKKYIH